MREASPDSTCHVEGKEASVVSLGTIVVEEYVPIHLDRGVGTSGRWDEVVGTRENLEWGGVACEPGSADGAVGAARGAHARDVDEAGVGLDHPGQPRLDPGQHVDHAGEGHEVAGAGHATAGGGGGVGVPAGNRIHAARGDLVL